MRFSVLIPAYKQKFLKECIQSIIDQTYQNFEIIIVNDASPENLDCIVDSFYDKRVKYYVNEINCGGVNVVDNWNICLKYATGEYTICMGDDDKLLPNCLEEYNKLIEKYPNLDIYHGCTEIIDEKSHVIGLQEARPLYESVYSMIWHRWNGRKQYIGDFLFKTITLKQNGGFYKLPLAWGSDDITSVIIASENGIANTQVPVFQYRSNSQTISNTGNIPIKLNAINMEESWYINFIDKNQPNPNDSINFTYWYKLKNGITNVFCKRRIYTFLDYIRKEGIIHSLSWGIKNRNKYKFNSYIIIYSACLYLYLQLKKI